MSLLAMKRKRSQNPDPLNPKGSATRKSKTSPSAMTYWSGIIQLCAFVNRKIRGRVCHPPVPDWACNCVDKKAKNPGKPPNFCTFQGNGDHNPHPGCTNCIGWVQAVLQDCYNQASAGQQ